MLKLIQTTLQATIFKDGRSRALSRNMLLGFLFKGLNLFASFLLVPLTINYLNPQGFGIWITISSIIGWIGYFDLGIGSGLRNKLTEAISLERFDLAKKLVSTAYFLVFLLVLFLLIAYIVFTFFFDITWLLGLDTFRSESIDDLFSVLFVLFLLRFLVKLIKDVDMAHQASSNTTLYDLISGLCSLAAIFILSEWDTEPSIMKLSFFIGITPVLTFLVASIWLFNTRYKKVAPSFRFIDLSVSRSIFGLGLKLLFIQLANVIFYSTDAVIISKVLGAEAVTPYAISNKYFGIQLIVFSIIVLPYWNAFTEAYLKNEVEWIHRILKRLLLFWIASVGATLVMSLCSDWFYGIWIGSEVNIPLATDILMAVFTLLATFNLIFSTFLFGVGKLNLLLTISIISALANIPLSLFFCSMLGMGVSGVLMGSVISVLPLTIVLPLQTYGLLKQAITQE